MSRPKLQFRVFFFAQVDLRTVLCIPTENLWSSSARVLWRRPLMGLRMLSHLYQSSVTHQQDARFSWKFSSALYFFSTTLGILSVTPSSTVCLTRTDITEDSKYEISKFYQQIQRTDASDHICVSQWSVIRRRRRRRRIYLSSFAKNNNNNKKIHWQVAREGIKSSFCA